MSIISFAPWPCFTRAARKALALSATAGLAFNSIRIPQAIAASARLSSECQQQISNGIANAGFKLVQEGSILNAIRNGPSSEAVFRQLWASGRPPVEISSNAMIRDGGRYYVYLTVPPSPGLRGEVTGSLENKLKKLQASVHYSAKCVQTLSLGFLRSGPYACTYFDSSRGQVRNVRILDIPPNSRPVLGLDFCE